MAFESEGEQYADEYQDPEYLDEDIPTAGNDTWEEPADEYAAGFDDGAQVGVDGYDAGIARDLIQGQWDIQRQAAEQQQLDEWQQQLDGAVSFLGRDLSPGELSALAADGQDPNGYHDVADALNAYWTPEDDTPAGRSEHRTKIMRNSIEAVRAANEPGFEIELPGSADNWGLEPGASIYQRAEAKQRWAEQQVRIRNQELTYDPDEQDD